MNYKVEKVLKDNKKFLVLFLIIWVVLEWTFISPLSVAIGEATKTGVYDGPTAFSTFFKELGTFTSFFRIFKANTLGIFLKATLIFTIAEFLFISIGVVRSRPKHEFTDIEHGSSDWSEGGEQYRVLSKHKGIILAENNYLPVNKPGNVNVLIVGRIWCW